MRLIFIDEIFKVFLSPPEHRTMRGSLTHCPGCGVQLPDRHIDVPDRFSASGECFCAFSDLQCYTVAKRDPAFIHQHAVDAYEAQHAGGPTRNITVAFGLIGLYLALEKGYTGRQVQQAHRRIAPVRKDWPRMEPPYQPASLTVMDVLTGRTDEEKDALIRKWMASVWESWGDRQEWVRKTTDDLLQSF
jgi:hypothetical protein